MIKSFKLLSLFLFLVSSTNAQIKGLIISEFYTNPSGNDAPFEYVELVATRNINFSMTPYTIVFADNGVATNAGWREGGSTTYAFQITTGSVTKGQVVYVGGTSMLPLFNSGKAIRKVNNGITNGDGFGNNNTNGTLGNGGSHADGFAIFNGLATTITSSTIPVDAVFYGSAVGNSFKTITKGYQLPVNDKYSGGKLLNTSFLAPDPSSGEIIKATSGTFKPSSNIFTSPRFWTKTTVPSYNTSSISLSSGPNILPLVSLQNPTIAVSFTTNTVGLYADAVDADGTITKVQFYNGTTLLSTKIMAPYTYTWTNVLPGTYTITAKATDSNSATVTSKSKIITIQPPVNLPPSISFNSTASKYVDLNSGSISCVRNNATDPFIVNGIDIYVNDENLSTLTFTMLSSNPSILPNTNFSIAGIGNSRKFKINPITKGYSNVTLKVKDAQGLINSIVIKVAVSESLPIASSIKNIYHTGVADGSTAISIDNNYMFVGHDEVNTIELYSRNNSGLPLYKFDLTPYLNLTGSEIDIEASFKSTLIPNRIYWIGSLSNSKTGEIMPDRNRIFATDIIGTGASAQLQFVGYYGNLRNHLIWWGDSEGYDFSSKAADGIEPKRIDGFNVEGLEMGPDGTTLFIAFRAPYVGINNDKALICPLLNFESWFNNGNPTQAPTFGNGIELDLNNHGIRSIAKNSQNEYLIVAGSYDTFGTFELYKWLGNDSSEPVLINTNLTNMKPEGIISVPNSLMGTVVIDLLSDFGTNVFYGDGIENKDLANKNYRKYLTSSLSVNIPASFLSQKLIHKNNETKEERVKNTNAFICYPNPVKDIINIIIQNPSNKNEQLLFYNSYGIIVKSIELQIDEREIKIDLSDFNTGLYIVKYTGTSDFFYKINKS